MLEKQMQVNTLDQHAPGPRPPDRRSRPAAGRRSPTMHAELDPATYGLTIWDLDREFLTGTDTASTPGRRQRRMPLGDILGVLRDAYCRTIGIEYMHIQDPAEKRWIQEHVEGADRDARAPTSSATSWAGSTRPRRSRSSSARSTSARSDSASRAPRAPSRCSTPCSSAAADDRHGRRRHRHGPPRPAQRARQHRRQDLRAALPASSRAASTPSSIQGSGDVKYHLGQTRRVREPRSATTLAVELAANPSHLEAVDPVVVGMVRATHGPRSTDDADEYPVLPAADPRRRRLRRPGRGGRDAQPAPRSTATASAAPST